MRTKKKVETQADIQKKIRKTVVEISLLLESPWLTESTRAHLTERRRILSQEAYK